MRNKQSGFSLIEVMISFVLIGVGALGLVKLQAYIEQRADYAMHSIEALNLAEQNWSGFVLVALLQLTLPYQLQISRPILSLGMMFHILSILCLGLYPLQPCRGSQNHSYPSVMEGSPW